MLRPVRLVGSRAYLGEFFRVITPAKEKQTIDDAEARAAPVEV